MYESPWSIPRGLILLLGGAGGFVVMFGLQAFQGIVGPAFLALMLVITMIPLQQWMLRKGWPQVAGHRDRALSGRTAILLALGLILLYAAARFAHSGRRATPRARPQDRAGRQATLRRQPRDRAEADRRRDVLDLT